MVRRSSLRDRDCHSGKDGPLDFDALLWFALTVGPVPEQPKEDDRAPALKGLDPIGLAEGKDLKGDESRSAVHGRYRYLFATKENLEAFRKQPERYAIQFGGACMRMGPLSGCGHPDRYYVHDGRIYIFASDSCRNAFKANPEKFIDKADEPPKGTAQEIEQGKRILDKAVEGVGGAKLLKQLESVETRIRLTYTVGEGGAQKKHEYARVTTAVFPGGFVVEDTYDKSQYGWKLLPDGGYLTSDKCVLAESSVREYMERELRRDPLHILKEWNDGKGQVVALEKGKAGEIEVERVAFSHRGATTILCIDPKTGRVLQAGYRGRLGGGIGQVTQTFADFRDVKGLSIPHEVRTDLDGKEQKNPSIVIESVAVNGKIDPKLLEKPE